MKLIFEVITDRISWIEMQRIHHNTLT